MAIVGSGRLGCAFARALRGGGLEVEGPLGRGVVPRSPIVLLCVPDGQIPAVAELIGAGGPRPETVGDGRRFVGHVSGATPLAALEAAGGEVFGLHPLQTFAGGEGAEAFKGVGCAVAGATLEALAVARELAERLGMTPTEISDAERGAYHAAASVASNFLVTLQATAEELAAGAGIEPADARALLGPLVRRTVENWIELGPAAALTGPVARGDDATVAHQRDAVEVHAPHLLPLFDELVERTRALVPAREAVAA
ncbi:MAG TPA: DUF2520 domain-containing protein [Thermoleophilaceae bacterium]|nr:DUF2520 domain-containing protein [Thermoleophilaceae bacterium]